MTWAIAEGDLPSTVAPSGTFSVPYPAGYSQADFIGANAATDHRFVLNNNELFKASLGQISVSFGETSVVVTNLSAISWTFETPFIVQLDIEDNPQAEAEQQAATTFETTAEFVAADAVPETKNVVRVLGELTAGDGNEYLLQRGTSTEPTHPAKRKQTASPIWWSLVRQDRLNSGNFNIRGNGSYDDSAGVEDAIMAAAEYGSLITFRPVPDRYMIGDLTVEPGNKNIRVEAYGAYFYAIPVASSGLTRPMLNIDSNVGSADSRPSITWRGGKFDAEGLPYGNTANVDPWDHSPGGARGGCLGFTRFRKATLEDVWLKGGQGAFDPNGFFLEDYESDFGTVKYVAGDQGVTFVSCKYVDMNRVVGQGLPDALVYPRANADMSEPDYENVEGIINVTNCWAIDCYQGAYTKYAGGQVNVVNFNSLRTWFPVNLLADYVPQINPLTGVQENGTGYQPYTGSVNGVRARQTYGRVVQIERAQNFFVKGINAVDWGRLPDGTANVAASRLYVPIVFVTGSRNGVISGVAGRLRDWDGGITDKFSHNAAFLDGVVIEAHDHTADDDPVGGGTPPSNTLASAAIKVSDVTLWGTPVEVDDVAYSGSTNGRVDYVATDVSATARKGIGTIVRVRGAADRTIDISGCHAYDLHSTGQAYIFNGTTEQWIDGVLVPSPAGDGYTAGKEFLLETTIAAGVITVPTQRRVSPLTVSVSTQGAAASDDLDTISGSFDGQTIIVRRETNGQDVVLKNGTGNLSIGADITLTAQGHLVWLNRRGNTWYLVSSTVP